MGDDEKSHFSHRLLPSQDRSKSTGKSPLDSRQFFWSGFFYSPYSCAATRGSTLCKFDILCLPERGRDRESWNFYNVQFATGQAIGFFFPKPLIIDPEVQQQMLARCVVKKMTKSLGKNVKVPKIQGPSIHIVDTSYGSTTRAFSQIPALCASVT